MGFKEDLLDAAMGLGEGATQGFGDNLAVKLLAQLPVNDDTGIEREYAGGQANQYLSSIRDENRKAQERSPWLYGAGNMAGDMATSGLLASAGGGPAAMLALDMLSSVGHEDADTLEDAAKAAGEQAAYSIGVPVAGVAGLKLGKMGADKFGITPIAKRAAAAVGEGVEKLKARFRPPIDEIPAPLNIHTRPTVPAPPSVPTVPAPAPVPAAPTVPAPPPPAGSQLRTVPAPAPQTLRPTVPAPAPAREAATVRPAANAELEEAIRAFAGRYNA